MRSTGDSTYEYELRGGGAWGVVERRGKVLRVTRNSRYTGTVTGRVVEFPLSLVGHYDGEDLNENSLDDGGPPFPFGEVVLAWLDDIERNGGAVREKIRVVEPGFRVG